MEPRSRWARLSASISWSCLLAAFLGGQLVFWQDSSDPFAPVQGFWLKVFLPLGAVPFLTSRWPALKDFARTWPARAAFAWMAWLWVAAFLGPVEFHADAFKTAFEYCLYTLPFFIAAVASASERRALWTTLLSGSLVAAFYGFCQHFSVDPWRWSTNFGGRPLGTIGNPNFFGGHLLLAWGLCLAAFLHASAEKRWRWAGALVLLFLVMLYTITVGVWLGMAFSLVLAWAYCASNGGEAVFKRWNFPRASFWKASGIGALLLAVVCLSPPGRHRILEFRDGKNNSIVNREMMWKAAISLWKTAPVQGAGLCTYRPLYPKLQAEILNTEKDKGWNYVVTWLPHQNYLYWLSETGLIGLGLFLFFWGLCMAVGWKRAADGEPLLFGALLALAGLLGASFLNTFSNIAPTAFGAAFCLGLLALKPGAANAQKHAAAEGIALEAWALTLIAAFLLGQSGGIELLANRYTRQAGRAEKREDRAEGAILNDHAAALGVANFTQQALVGVRFNQGEDLRQTGHLPEAIEAYRKDLGPNPWAPEVHNMLGDSLGQLGAATRRGDLVAEGAEHLRTAAWLNPGYSTALINLGGSYMTLGNLSGAAQAWTEVLHYEPDNKEALGYLQMLKGKH